jgi:hypothetical protein
MRIRKTAKINRSTKLLPTWCECGGLLGQETGEPNLKIQNTARFRTCELLFWVKTMLIKSMGTGSVGASKHLH